MHKLGSFVFNFLFYDWHMICKSCIKIKLNIMKTISKLVAIVSLTVISFAVDAQEIDKTKKTVPVRNSIVQKTPVKSKSQPKPVQAVKPRPVKKVAAKNNLNKISVNKE